jgi:transcriptional regulator with XRE-family HTH domain
MIALRMKKVREVRGWKQSAVAQCMKVTQQAYSFLEQGHGSPRIDTLTRYCEVMQIDINFLLAFDLPVTEENIEKFGTKGYSELIAENKRLDQKLEFFNYLIKTNSAESLAEKTKAISIAAGQ